MSFQLFRSADRFRPSRFGENGLALERGFIHATSMLVPWKSSAKLANSAKASEMPFFAKLSTFRRLAPPYGVAVARAMSTFGVCETMQRKLLKWASITHAYQFAQTGKPEPDFVTLSRLAHCATASRLMPQEICDSLRPHSALFDAGSKGRRAFVDFLKGSDTEAGIARHGYVQKAWS